MARALGVWVFFLLVFLGLRFLELPGLGSAAAPVAAAIATAATLFFIARLLKTEGGEFRDVGLNVSRRFLPHFVLGTALGIALAAVMIGAMLLLTPLEISPAAGANLGAVLVTSFVVLTLLALLEEVTFRSYPLFRLSQAWGIRGAIYVTSIVFAFYHGLMIENLIGPGVWGLYFGLMAVMTRSIALPTGFHVGLNWVLAIVGDKPQYTGSLWELSINEGTGYIGAETLGLAMQIVLLIIGVLMIEWFLARERRGGT
ncbi:MAG: CPBP family intramembrane glutamic endopeptidase [Pseudomonadota bacterium]